MSGELEPKTMTVVLNPDTVTLDEYGRVKLLKARVSEVIVHHAGDKWVWPNINIFCPTNWKCGRSDDSPV